MSLPPARTRAGLVTACQQLLTFGVVVAVLTPAAGVLSLDVVRDDPAAPTAGAVLGTTSPRPDPATRPDRPARPATVPEGTVDAELTDHQLTAPPSARVAPDRLEARATTDDGSTTVRSEPLPVEDFGTVGVTWAPQEDLEHDAVDVRTREDGGAWSGWTEAEVDDDHAPDPGSVEATRTRPGTDAVVVGEVDAVQVRVTSDDAPADLVAAVVEPGAPVGTDRARPEIDAGATSTDSGSDSGVEPALELAAAAGAPRPEIFSRAQWGADERLRSGSPSYGSVRAGFVHHTVNANDYTREQVPGILRSIYAYHTRSRGWSDVGYNFLVDKFGRIWEGRYGGVTRAVVGAHTLGYNEYSFAMSAIGNFDVVQPPQAVVDAYAALLAWKLGIHGVDAGSMRQQVGSRSFPAISGHRDAGSTACPGRYLYARLGDIRRGADALQEGPSQPDPEPEPEPEPEPAPLDSDLVGSPYPDLVVRRAADQQAVVVPTAGLTSFGPGDRVAGDWSAWRELSLSRDLTGDGRADLLARDDDGRTAVAAREGAGSFAPPVPAASGPGAEHDLVVAVGDADGDGVGDVVARKAGTSRLVAFRGDGGGGFDAERLGLGWARYDRVVAAGDLTGDGDPDLLGRDADGGAWLRAGSTGQDYAAPVVVDVAWNDDATWDEADVVAGAGDLTRDGVDDLVVRRADGASVVVPGRTDGTLGRGVGRVARIGSGAGLTGGLQVGGSPRPDLLVRRGARLVWLVNEGTTETLPPVDTGVDLSGAALVVNAGDWDGDGEGDLITRTRGALALHRGDGTGRFAAPVVLGGGFGRVRALQAVGDVTGDGRADLTGRRRGELRVYPGDGADGVGAGQAAELDDPRDLVEPGAYESLVQVSDLRRGRVPDLVGTDGDGLLWLLPVTRGGVGEPRLLAEGTEVAGPLG